MIRSYIEQQKFHSQENKTSNRKIHAITAPVLYSHQSETISNFIIKVKSGQQKLSIASSPNQMRKTILPGRVYRFGYCFTQSANWTFCKNPDEKVKLVEDYPETLQNNNYELSEIADKCEKMNEMYIDTQLHIIKVLEPTTIVKGTTAMKLTMVKCFSQGYLVDVTCWGMTNQQNQKLNQLVGKWVQFSGVRVKKTLQWRFVLNSSVFMQFKQCSAESSKDRRPYFPLSKYENLSSVYQIRSLAELSKLCLLHDRLFSTVQTPIVQVVQQEYWGCSICKTKTNEDAEHTSRCKCTKNTPVKVKFFRTSLGTAESSLPVACFDTQISKKLSVLKPTEQVCLNIKSVRKINPDGKAVASHVIVDIVA